MARVVCIAGSQPAFGKTTTAVNLSFALAMAGQKTLLVDWSPKADATRQVGVKPVHLHGWCSDPPEGSRPPCPVVDGLDLATGRWDPQTVEVIEGWGSDECRLHGSRWSEELVNYDVVLIDCPSETGPFTESALWAADEVLLPLRCERTVLQHIPQLMETIRRVHSAPEKSLEFAGVLLTQFAPEDGLAVPIETEVRDFFGEIVFETMIPQDATVAEAIWRGRPLLEMAPGSRAAHAYVELCMEVLGR